MGARQRVVEFGERDISWMGTLVALNNFVYQMAIMRSQHVLASQIPH